MQNKIKTNEVCKLCKFGYDNNCKGCTDCEDCPRDHGGCECLYIEPGDVCPYFEEA